MSSTYSFNLTDSLMHEASLYAKLQGLSLAHVIENLLDKWVKEQSIEEKIKHFPISDEIISLSNRMDNSPVDLDYKSARDNYLNEKYFNLSSIPVMSSFDFLNSYL